MINNKRLYLSGSLVTFFGDALYTFVISWWLIQLTGDTKLLGLVLGLGVLPAVVLLLLAGNLIDSLDNKLMMVFCDLISGLVCIAAYFFVDTEYKILVLIVTTFSLFFFTNVFTVSSKSIVKFIFDKEELVYINSYHTFLKQASKIIAPLLGGWLILELEPRTFILLNGITFCITAILESKFKYVTIPTRKKKKNVLSFDGFKLIREQKLSNMIIFIMTNNFFMASLAIFVPFIVVKHFNSNSFLGVILTCQALGSLASTLVIKRIKFKFSYEAIAIFASLSLLVCSYNIICLGIGMFLFGLFVTWFNVQFITDLQIRTPDDIIGRVFSVLVSLGLILVPISNLIFGYVGDYLGKYALVIVGGILTVINIYFLIFASKSLRTEKAQLEEGA